MKLVRSITMAMALGALSTVAGPAEAAPAWQDVGDINGVHVWRREEPGTGLLSFRGETVAPVNIGKLVAVFSDKNQRQYWVDRYAASNLIEKNGNSEIYWIKFKLPAVISDRDYVLKADAEVDAGNKVFTVNIKSVVDPRKGPDDCCVRATVNRTFYRFTALKAVNGVPQTKLEVEVNTDPKGLLPNFIVNQIQKEWPSKTLNGLVRQTKAASTEPMTELANWHE
jgi:hypothetical protein